MTEEIVNEDIEKTSNSIKSQDEAVEAVNNMEKIIRSKKPNVLWLAQVKYLKNSKWNENFLGLVKELDISKSTKLFKISIVKFKIKYSREKKSSLSLPFLKNNFKMIKEIRHENASEFKQVQF